MRKIQFIFFILLTLGLNFSCKNEISLANKYTGFWAETKFEYNFYSVNNEFVFKTQGHFGNTTTKGKYSIIDSIILLHPYTDWTSFHGVLKNRLVYKGKIGCIRDYEDRYYCENVDTINHFITQRENLKDSIKVKLYSLTEVKQIVTEYPNFSRWNPKHPRFRYDGITLIRNKEYHGFQLQRKNEDENLYRPLINIQGQYYLINLEENLIYKHHTRGDSISIVEELF